MGNISFQVFKETDEYIISAFEKIATELNDQGGILFLAYSNSNQLNNLPLKTLREDVNISKLLALNSSVFSKLQFTSGTIATTRCTVSRMDGFDQIDISMPDNSDIKITGPFIATVHKNFRTLVGTESISRLLGKELDEFYKMREKNIAQLEQLTTKLVEDNQKFREKIDTEKEDYKKGLENKFEDDKEKLQKQIKEQQDNLKLKETDLAEKGKDLDDRSARHARRQIRQDLKKEIASRNKEFTLSEKTISKRKIVSYLFILLISVSLASLVYSIVDIARYEKFVEYNFISIFLISRLVLSALAFALSVVFFIKWNDTWFRQHADEEFALKRLDLDIDRASWVVEMALEWKAEKGTEIPEELTNRLTNNLFVGNTKTETLKHPVEDIASALLKASGAKINFPGGLGEFYYNKKAINKIQKDNKDA